MFDRRSQRGDRRGPRTRLRARLRRHGVIPRPAELRRLLRANDVRFTGGNAVAFYQDGASGLRAMLGVIGEAREENYELLVDLCDTMEDASLCAMGGMTPYPVRSVLKYFAEDFAPGARGADE